MSLQRVFALVMRYLYLMRSSWPRLIELIYWPTMQMILWGFINQFFVGHSEWVAQAAGLLIGAVLLWDVLFRAQLGVSVVFFEEMYSRNLGHLFVSPLRPYELVMALLTVSFLRTSIGVGAAAGLAVVLYRYSIFDMGLPLVAFFANLLVMGWAIGLMVVALVLRYGLGAESLAWAVIFAVAPLSGIYYPISVLPDWLQKIALLLPSSHVFEGMRAVVRDHVFSLDSFWMAVLLNLIYLLIGFALYLFAFHVARKRGLLLQMGE
ncbi:MULTISPECIES: ABC transporter permease [Methylocaldum]|uniref:ABC transporter permease n=1 Tax=unclassified Methylocaldum TaxID=2622260 RepID=UPI00197BF75D|nr:MULTISPECIES: ABC transporter permease [unclassified Methylocaldum]MBP1149911.1 ABC-2 type transport system permease protein [Methylocaldum sp. RMAD-M]MDV3240503.1 ABC transporter permease [Methylocaldum sp.]